MTVTALAALVPVVTLLAISVVLLVQSCRIYRRAEQRSEQALSMYRRAEAAQRAAFQSQRTAEAILLQVASPAGRQNVGIDLRSGLN